MTSWRRRSTLNPFQVRLNTVNARPTLNGGRHSLSTGTVCPLCDPSRSETQISISGQTHPVCGLWGFLAGTVVPSGMEVSADRYSKHCTKRVFPNPSGLRNLGPLLEGLHLVLPLRQYRSSGSHQQQKGKGSSAMPSS